MKTISIIIFVLLLVSSALADNVSVDVDDTNTNTNTNNLIQEQSQTQTQVWENNQKRGHIVAPMPGAFVGASPVIDDGQWHPLCGENFTVEELRSVVDSASFYDRRGFFSWARSPVKRTLRIKRYEGNIGDDAVVVLIQGGGKTLGSFEGEGPYGYPLDAILARVLLQAVEETGAKTFQVSYRVRKDSVSSGLSVGSGAAGSVTGGNAGDNSAAAVGLGGLIGSTTASYARAYDVSIRAVRLADGEQPVCGGAAVATGNSCGGVRAKIAQLQEEIKLCTRFCLNNLKLRKQLGDAYVDLFVCTGDKRYLSSAIKQYEIAERNFNSGHDIVANQAEANQVLAQVYFYWAGCIREARGRAAAMSFAKQKKLERIPQGFVR